MSKRMVWSTVLFVLSSCGLAYAGIDPEGFTTALNGALSHQVTQFTVAFSIAAWIHSGRVKKEIKEQLGGISVSVDGVASALRQDLKAQSQRLGAVEISVTKIGERVGILEQKTKQGDKS